MVRSVFVQKGSKEFRDERRVRFKRPFKMLKAITSKRDLPVGAVREHAAILNAT